MRTRRSHSEHPEPLASNPDVAVLVEHLTNRATKAESTPVLKAARIGKSNILNSPMSADMTVKVPSDLPPNHYLLKSPSSAKSKRAARNLPLPPVQSTPLGPRRHKRPLLHIRSPRLGLQDENRILASSSRPVRTPRAHSPLPPSSPPSYIGRSGLVSRHPLSHHAVTGPDDENKENIDTDGVVVASSLVRRENSDPFGFFALERKLKAMRDQRVLGKRRPLLSTAEPSTSKGVESTQRMPLGSLSPRPRIPILDVIPQSPADEHNIDDMYADLESDGDKENVAPSESLPIAAPLIAPQAIVLGSGSASDLPDPLRTPHKRRRTYSTTPLSSGSSSPSQIVSPSPTKPVSSLRTARKTAPVQSAQLQPDESPLQKTSAGDKRKRDAEDEVIDPMTYSRNLEKLLPRRPAKRAAKNTGNKGKGRARARAPVNDSEGEASAKGIAPKSSRGKARGSGRGRGRGRGQATKPVASSSRVTRSQVKGKAKAKEETEHIDIDEDDVRAILGC